MNILVDHGSFANLGDISMLEGAVQQLAHTLPDAQLHVVYRDIPAVIWDLPTLKPIADYAVRPSITNALRPLLKRKAEAAVARAALAQLAAGARAGDMRVETRGSIISARAFCEPFDALHIVGGGMLNDVFCIQLLNKCALMLTFAEQGKPVVLSGQQLGPFQNIIFRQTLRRALRRARFVGLREPTMSVQFCRDAQLHDTQFAVMGDDSFGVPALPDTAVTPVLQALGLQSKNFLAFNMRVAPNYAPEFARHIQHLATLADRLASETQLPILFVPIDIGQGHGDIPSAHRVISEMKTPAQVLNRSDLTTGLVKSILGHASGAVGASYHFCTFALGAGTPTVNVFDGRYYAQKGRGLAAFWGDERLTLSLHKLNVNDAAHHICQVFYDNALRERLRARGQQATQTWHTVFERAARECFLQGTRRENPC